MEFGNGGEINAIGVVGVKFWIKGIGAELFVVLFGLGRESFDKVGDGVGAKLKIILDYVGVMVEGDGDILAVLVLE